MDEEYKKLRDKYARFNEHVLRNGRLLTKDTKIGTWGVTPLPETFELFKLLNLGQYGKFLDLGSGDGRIVLLASLFGVDSHGIEFDDWLIKNSLLIKHRMDSDSFDKAKFIHGNFMDHNISKYPCIFISPDKPFYRKGLERKIKSELKGHLVVHGWEFHPTALSKKEEHVINGEKFCVYS